MDLMTPQYNSFIKELYKKKESVILNRINDLKLLNVYFEAMVKKESERLLCVKNDDTEYYFFIDHRNPVFLVSFRSYKSKTEFNKDTNNYEVKMSTTYTHQIDFVPKYILDNLKEML